MKLSNHFFMKKQRFWPLEKFINKSELICKKNVYINKYVNKKNKLEKVTGLKDSLRSKPMVNLLSRLFKLVQVVCPNLILNLSR